jgi:hypothetical protein
LRILLLLIYLLALGRAYIDLKEFFYIPQLYSCNRDNV